MWNTASCLAERALICDDEISAPVEVTGLHDDRDGVHYLTVRSYKVLEEDSWFEEE
jgi:hypothetical protein